MKKRARFATTEELIADITNHEDPDSVLLVSITRSGGVGVGEFDGSLWGRGQTFKEALLNFSQAFYRQNDWALVYTKLDWSDVIDTRTEN